MSILITRTGNNVSASTTDGKVWRSYEALSIQSAVDLENKLTDDKAFAGRWVHNFRNCA